MNNEKEIPFGAFDSELMHQEIFIPEGFEATIDGNKIILTRIENEDEKIRKALIEYFNEQCDMSDWNGVYGYQVVAWLEKQGQEPRKVSIWNHWKDGICGNEEGKLIYLIKIGDDYSLSSSLGYECDYILLSDLDNLMIEKQGTSYTKRDVDNAFVEGMVLAKDELEKQGERDKPTYNTYSKDVQLTQEEYDKKRVSDEATIKEVEAYKKGLEDAQKIFEKQGEQKQKPTNEDMKEALRTEYEKGRADTIAQMQKEWSEEDEVKINRIVACLENLNVADNDILLKDVDWLKSLKERYFWKPKTWEIQILESVIEKGENPKNYSVTPHSILEQLKKLKGE